MEASESVKVVRGCEGLLGDPTSESLPFWKHTGGFVGTGLMAPHWLLSISLYRQAAVLPSSPQLMLVYVRLLALNVCASK